MPRFTRAHIIQEPVLLDPREGLVGYRYTSRVDYISKVLYVYNYKEDRMVYQSPDGFSISIRRLINDQYGLALQSRFNGEKNEHKHIFYNWRTDEIAENDLTETLNQNRIDLIISPDRNMHPAKRYLFGDNNIIRQTVKITWGENYSDVSVTPLSYLVPSGNSLNHFILSADGFWGTTLVSGYRGLYDERLCKRAFFHLDERYPNGISMPVITEDYEEYQWDYSAFVQHPVHGMCLAQEWHKEGKLYLRLYKMSDVLAEINRQLPEKDK